MRLAIYDASPVIGGLSTWAWHAKAGLIAAGHDADVVTFTKSGRPRVAWGRLTPGTDWTRTPPDATGAYKDCRKFLAPYDAVVLAEVFDGLQDRQARRNEWSVPAYLRVMELSGKPFTTGLHWFSFAQADVPYAARLVALPNFTGRGFAHADPARVLKDNAALQAVKWEHVPHPYVRAGKDELPPSGVAGFTGRLAHLNGPQLVAMAPAYKAIPELDTLYLYGACSVSNKPSFSLELFEALRDHLGYEGRRDGDDPFRPHPWKLERAGHVISYRGGYRDGVNAASGMTVHVSVMAEDKSTGAECYSQLEAMDAGCVPVATNCHWRRSFRGFTLPGLLTTPSTGTVLKNPVVQTWLRDLAALTDDALSLPDDERARIAAHNREVLTWEHDPAWTARAITEALS